MADRVFCIDFGSAFTKVALRRDPGAQTELIAAPNRRGIGDVDFCIPSVVAVDRRGAKQVVECGDQAADRRSGDGISVYPNWKKWLFRHPTPADGPPQVPPLDALLRSAELRDLAARFGVSAGEVAYLEHLVGTARRLVGGEPGRGPSVESRQHAFAAGLAPYFLRWLRQQVLAACDRLPAAGLKFDDIPVRVAVPALPHPSGPADHPGARALLDALRKAGWPVHPDRPIVTEPYANAIGVLTNGTNAIGLRRRVQLGVMFSRGPFITVLRNPDTYPTYRVVVIDVGAFTTDFAAVTLDTNGQPVEDPDAAIKVFQDSVPLGVSDLDARMKAALPAAADALDQFMASEWETFRRSVYADGKPYRRPGLVIGGPADAEPVRETLAAFARHVGVEVAKFCGRLTPAARQELVLTGGGCLIPTVREAVQQAAQSNGHGYVKTHAPAIKKEAGGPPVHRLDERFTRGGTALGGGSVYFERDFY